MEPAKTDQELVALVLKNRDEYRVLVERYEVPLRRYVGRLGADDELAKDILQESFIKAYLNLNDYDTALSFSAWMYRIAHNEAMSQFRKARVRPSPLKREEDLMLFEMIPDPLDIVMEADAAMDRGVLRDAIAGLESRYRDILVLRFFEEKSYNEISDILRMPEGTVATHINRAKQKLRELMKGRAEPRE
ncbi:MAG: subfamily polymerase sigma factor [Candidatus Adlerbacteria bacterium]|nr:subfamily polymerase sigma factor [Candidatus Adlerbacteria bacterium]